MGKRILVAGGCGFIGSHACERLLEQGHRVVCVDNLVTGVMREKISRHPNYFFIESDIQHLDYREPLDEIWHFACVASPVKFRRYSLEILDTCYLGTKNLLELARRNRAKIMAMSTSEIYGVLSASTFSEPMYGQVNTVGNRSCYDEGKRVMETLVYEYSRKYDLAVRIPRIFNCYGPGMTEEDGRVMPEFIRCALENKPVRIFGNGSQTRSFCHVRDMVDGLLALMASEVDTPTNIGNPDEITIYALAEKILEMTHSHSSITYCDMDCDDPINRKPDISKAKQLLGWEPKISLEDGLREMIGQMKGERMVTMCA